MLHIAWMQLLFNEHFEPLELYDEYTDKDQKKIFTF